VSESGIKLGKVIVVTEGDNVAGNFTYNQCKAKSCCLVTASDAFVKECLSLIYPHVSP
jgi:hypothetical protein